MTQCKHRWVLVEDEEDSNIWWIQCRDCGKDANDSDVNSVLDEYYANQERWCETCRHWSDWSDGTEEWVYCNMTDCHWRADEHCSRWEAKDA